MYSVVLLMALSGGAETPAFCFGRCNGCNCSCNYASCHGCNSCSCRGGLFSRRCHGCNSCSCSCNGYVACSGCHGVVYTGCCSGVPVVAPPAKPMPGKEGDKKEAAGPASATIIVTLPADAKLAVDDAPTTSTSSTRVLVSPTLEPGRDYHYTLKGEIVRDGQTVVATQRITVRAGEETRVPLDFPVASVVQK